jgi:chromosome segregation ATPase
MNLVGKIFIVVILLMSVLFMAFAMALYATHQNWQAVVKNELDPQLREAKEKNTQLTAQKEKLKQQYDGERAAKTQALAKLENELRIARDELAQLDAKLAQLEQAKRKAVADMDSTQANAADLRKELEGQRTTTEGALKDRNADFKEVVRLTDLLNQATNERDLLKKRTDELAKDLKKAAAVSRVIPH